MNTYIVKGKSRELGAIGVLEPFEVKIKAWSNEGAREGVINVLSATREHVQIESCEFGGYDSEVIYFDTSAINSIGELKRAVSESKAPYFFSPDTMRFFNSRVSGYIRNVANGVIFITSEKFNYDSERFYTVRMFTNEGRINELSEFQEFATLSQAKHYADTV